MSIIWLFYHTRVLWNNDCKLMDLEQVNLQHIEDYNILKLVQSVKPLNEVPVIPFNSIFHR